jgi:hypothetical protein
MGSLTFHISGAWESHMARPHPASEADTDTPNSDDWHALKGELVALLDQVEQQVTQGAPQGPGVVGLSERVNKWRLRYQRTVGETRSVRYKRPSSG